MIHLHPTKLTKKPFFYQLVSYLESHPNCILREIKKAFPDEKRLEKHLEDYIQAGYIARQNRRYSLTLPFAETESDLVLDKECFVDETSPIYEIYLSKLFKTQLTNPTNALIIEEETHLDRHDLTLSNYFYKLQHQLPMSQEQESLYEILGDVNPDYALKYMTTFLLKFLKKEIVKQKRPDIFVESLHILGYLSKIESDYTLNLKFDKDNLILKVLKN